MDDLQYPTITNRRDSIHFTFFAAIYQIVRIARRSSFSGCAKACLDLGCLSELNLTMPQ
jgi:hypothetical protein